MLRFLAFVLTLLALGLDSPAQAASVRGRLTFDPSRSHLRAEDAVVFFAGAAGSLEPIAPPAPRQIVVRFPLRPGMPRVLVAPAGTVLEFQNGDDVFHRPVSTSAGASFELLPIAPGDQRSLVLETPGVIRVTCRLHDDDVALVLVLPHVPWTHPDSGGRFSLPAPPKGQYELRVWHPALGERVRTIEIGPTRFAPLDFRF